MTIKEAQKLVDVWIKEKGVRYFDELTNTTILMEEVGELARVISRKYGEQSIKKGEENLDLADELADVLWVLVCIAYVSPRRWDLALRESTPKHPNKTKL